MAKGTISTADVQAQLLTSLKKGAGGKVVSKEAVTLLEQYYLETPDTVAGQWTGVEQIAKKRAFNPGQHAAVEAGASSTISFEDMQSVLRPCGC